MVNLRSGGSSQASSTGAPGLPVPMQDTRSHYDPATAGYNPATGAAYSKPSAGQSHQETGYQPTATAEPTGYDRTAATSKLDTASESRAARTGEDVGRTVKGMGATVHVSFVICDWG